MRLTTEDPMLAREILRRAGAHATAYLDGLLDRPDGPDGRAAGTPSPPDATFARPSIGPGRGHR